MATHNQKEIWWDGYRCETSTLIKVDILGRYPVRLQEPLRNAAYAFDAVLRATGYPHPTGPTGSYTCRKIGGTNTWSLHAYGIAIDLDYGNNPHLREPIPRGFDEDSRFRITERQVEALEAIVNDAGDPIWKWLGWTIGDTMHFEADQPPHLCEPAGRNLMEYRGVRNVPDAQWAHDVIDWGIDAGVIVVGDTFVDDWERDEMTDGRFWTFLKRYDDARRQQ